MGAENEKNQQRKKKNEGKKEEAVAGGGQDNSNNNHGRKVITDARFSSMHCDPRFQKVPKNQSKVSIDSRFNRMFVDKNFSTSSARLDKRGKRKDQGSESHLRHYYRLEEEEEEEEEEKLKKEDGSSDDDEESEEIEKSGLQKFTSASLDSESSSESEPSKSADESESDTSSSTYDSDDEGEVYSDDEPLVQEENIAVIEQETHRLAVVNMDWSQVKAVDLYVLLSSFLPKAGQILSVAVYPSEFGLKRMEEEAVHGPIGLFDSDEEQNEDDDNEIDDEKLRAYEKSRLRYYFAAVECDSSATANHLYKACDGVEFERSSNVLDLRFIPDSMEFKHAPRDIATEAPTDYEGLDFHTRSLQHSKIHLSWDEDEPQRAKTLRRKFNADQLAELELKEFLASDDGETDDDENDEAVDGQSGKKLDKRDMYRALVQSGDDGSDGEDVEDKKDMEVTFNTGLEDISKRILEKKDKKSETVWEAYLRKRSEKKKARKNNAQYSSGGESSDTDQEVPEQPDDFFIEEPSLRHCKKEAGGKNNRKENQQQETDKEQEASRAELELLLADDQGADQSLKGYNLKPKKVKGKKGKDVPAADKLPSTDYDDPRFSALFTSPLFALDPTDPHFKRSAAYARQLVQKQQKGARENVADKWQMEISEQAQVSSHYLASKKDDQLLSDSMSSKKEKHELSSLVRSIKKKAQQVQLPTKDKTTKKDEPFQSDGTSRKKQKHQLSAMVQSVKKKTRV